MKKHLPSVLVVILFFALSNLLFAAVSITDANSINQFARRIEKLPSGGLMNLTFKSNIDDSLQPMLIKVPKDYNKSKPWPLLVVLHGLGDGPIVAPSIDSMVQIGPFGRGDLWYRDLGEKDVLECLELAKQIFNIDPDRIYLSGFSMGGAGTFDLGLKYPDIWAACAPVCGRITDSNRVANAKNLAFWIHTGSEDEVVPAKYSKKTYEKAVELGFKHWKYTEHEGMGHSFWVNWDHIEKWLLEHKRIMSPPDISFISQTPARAYWAEITEKQTDSGLARIDVETASQIITVKTSNVADYMLYLKNAPVKLSDMVIVIENGHEIFRGHSDGVFNRALDRRKTRNICAP